MSAQGNPVKRIAILGATLGCLLAITGTTSKAAAAEPVWRIDSRTDTTLEPGSRVRLAAALDNVGTAPTNPGKPVVFTATLPEGVSVADPNDPEVKSSSSLNALLFQFEVKNEYPCTAPDGSPLAGGESGVRCEFANQTPASVVGATSASAYVFNLVVDVAPEAEGLKSVVYEASGGGAATVTNLDPFKVSGEESPFGIAAFDGANEGANGSLFRQAAGHPDRLTFHLDFNTHPSPIPAFGDRYPVAPVKGSLVELPPGMIGNPTALGECTEAELANVLGNFVSKPLCPPSSQVGTIEVTLANDTNPKFSKVSILKPSIYNMIPPPGVAARFGFAILGTQVVLDARLRPGGEYRISSGPSASAQALAVSGATVTLWGTPGTESNTDERSCPGEVPATIENGHPGPTCKASGTPTAFLRTPTRCDGPLRFDLAIDSWWNQGRVDYLGLPDLSDPAWKTASFLTHEGPGYPANPLDPTTPWGEPVGQTGCAEVPVKGQLSAKPTSLDAETSSGLDVHVEIPNPGLENPSGIAASDIKGVNLALPRGITINPSQAEGLGVCSSAQYESTELSFHPDGTKGCPSDSKIGTVSVKTPLLKETIPGNVYVAKPYDNPFNSLLAIYIVLEEPERGILVKLPGEVRTNETSGQIEAEFGNLPQTPFESFDFHFREGARAPLVTPPACGTYESVATFTPWSDPTRKLTSVSEFQITRGIGGGPCPPGGTPGFKPSFSAGSINNSAGHYTPFDMRITRNDGEQDTTRFSAVLPPGVLGKLAGVGKCPEAAIATAKAKTGLQEIASPSCPANSLIGRSIVGAGVGSVLTYIPGKIYLGGPFHGDPLSVIAITPAVAGPFDVGTVVVHEALTLNPRTAEVEVDGSASDPIPHILKGIPAKLRDLRVYVDRQNFILNPTSCDPSSARATLFGGGANAFSSLDDVPVSLSDRFQAASCASLGFKPKLALKLKGGTARGGHPGLTATYTPRAGDANLSALQVTLPRSAFLDQAHIRTICTRVQFAAKACPKGSQYGFIRAWTPLLEEPLAGPVYLRSSNHKLPDLVFDLHGLVDVEVATRIDSFHGGIRASVEDAPDAPISKVLLRMQGAKKGLIVNSRNLCGGTNRAHVEYEGQSGKTASANPALKPDCGKAQRRGKDRRR